LVGWVLVGLVGRFARRGLGEGGVSRWVGWQRSNASNPLLVMFNAVNQSYFMGLFFLLAGV
ncbi:hypothetical protein, partial [Sphingomonas sp. ABOLD]|uniref:hypothetical protein n=1 Tax=Sphingomonas sp. ABOLD TaxID=1985877 RepID=UPI0019D14FCB